MVADRNDRDVQVVIQRLRALKATFVEQALRAVPVPLLRDYHHSHLSRDARLHRAMYLFQGQGDHHLPFVPGQCYRVTNVVELSGGERTMCVVKGGDTQGRRGTRHISVKRIVCVDVDQGDS